MLWIKRKKKGTKGEEDSSVAHVAEHHAKEERKGDKREEPRVHFFVAGHTIGIHNFLQI